MAAEKQDRGDAVAEPAPAPDQGRLLAELKSLQREVLEIAAREQQRLGQDLHDGTGQELMGLCLVAETLAEALAEQSSPEAELAAKLARGLQRALGQVRALARGL